MLRTHTAFAILALPALTACAHAWPDEGRGGLAERDAAADTEIRDSVETVNRLKTMSGIRTTAQVALAEEQLIRAQREDAAGLYIDSEESHLDALITLGGEPDFERQAGVLCLKQPCEGVN